MLIHIITVKDTRYTLGCEFTSHFARMDPRNFPAIPCVYKNNVHKKSEVVEKLELKN